MRFYTGGYTAEMDGHATGIGVLVAGGPHDVLAGGPLGFAGDLVGTGGSPSWITAHPTLPVLYAALEGTGAVQAFAQTGETSFTPLGAAVAAGGLACHVAVAPGGGWLVAACWGDGRVVRMPLDAVGRPSSPQPAEAAADPYPARIVGIGVAAGGGTAAGITLPVAGGIPVRGGDGRDPGPAGRPTDRAGGTGTARPDGDGVPERASRAHETVFLPRGRLATTDMGFDLVRIWRPTPAGLHPAGQVVLPRGSGPRHMLVHPSGRVYVVTELSQELFVLAPDASGAWRVVAASTLGGGALPGDAAAEIAASRDGVFLYVGMRGSDTVATLRVRGDGSEVRPVAVTESGVVWPRHHVVARDTLLVAGQRSDEVVSLTLDERTGVPGRVRHRTAVPSPTCLLAAR